MVNLNHRDGDCPRLPDGSVRMYICYSIDSTGNIAFQYSNSSECHLMQEFRAEASSHETILVDAVLEEYGAEDAYRDLGMHLLKVLGRVSDDALSECFLHFQPGTPVGVVLAWFEREFGLETQIQEQRAA